MDLKHTVKNRRESDFFKKYAINDIPEGQRTTRHYLHRPGIKVFELKQVHVKIYISHHCFLQEVLK